MEDVSESGSRRREVRRRFRYLRALRHNPRLRRRWLLIAGVIALAVVAMLAALANAFTVLAFDLWFTQGLQAYEWVAVSRVMYAVSLFGYSPWSVVTVAVGAGLIGLLLGWRDGLYLLAMTVLQGLVNAAIKRAIGRPRPLDSLVELFVSEHGFSFPSGHVMFYTVFFGLLAFFVLARLPPSALRWPLVALFGALIALVGPSRIVLGAHWLSDVIAAYLIGGVLLGLAIEAYLHYLAPQTPDAQQGLVRRLDEYEEGGPP